MASGFTLRGDQEMMRRLQALADAAAGQILLDSLKAGALLIEGAAVLAVHKVTGNLARSIHVEPGAKPAGIVKSSGAGLGAPPPSRTLAVVHIGTDVEYARRLEYGFSGADRLGRHYHQAPAPYLRPAFDENKEAAMRTAAAILASKLRGAA